jgi:hypothetical protein
MKKGGKLIIIFLLYTFECNSQKIIIIEENITKQPCDSVMFFPRSLNKDYIFGNYILLKSAFFFRYKAVILKDTCNASNRWDLRPKTKYRQPYLLTVDDVKYCEKFLDSSFITKDIVEFNDLKRKVINPHKFFYNYYRQYIGHRGDSGNIFVYIELQNKKAYKRHKDNFVISVQDVILAGPRPGKYADMEINIKLDSITGGRTASIHSIIFKK